KTLHPKVHGGLLARRDLPAHMETAKAHGISNIDLVVVNLYPFEATVARPDVSRENAIENIDIGGPSMVRSAAKNHSAVAVVTDPADYPELSDEIAANDGALGLATRRKLALKAFRHTSWYDHAIAEYLGHLEDCEERFPERKLVALSRVQALRYGENPHQPAAFYRTGRHPEGLGGLNQVSGKELSFNNLLDLEAAGRAVRDVDDRPFAVVIKHTNPCGAAVGGSIGEAFARAYDCDPLSAFGGIVGLNREFDLATAEQCLAGDKFLEAVIAPGFAEDAVEALVEKSKKKWRKSIRLVEVASVSRERSQTELRSVSGGVLMQDLDDQRIDAGEIKVVTERIPDDRLMRELMFGWTLIKHYKSNAIAITNHEALLGYGAGQTSRVDATEHALMRAGDKAKGAVLSSDAFFPFPDSIEKAAAAGVEAVIQPGGSRNDDAVIEACNKAGIAMVFTGMRHFRH
ncbi:MAG: bifunctional phosphoribosylaminoimidazolecarboxamide formyltransferase/IMP cyclohydrolase, partial [Nitrospira sp.]|nr:bifunctional phosphoribosylaminoimidazolecarboxamide formyltransferase/IMP cyclohydrolase [Nitrospira sp.]